MATVVLQLAAEGRLHLDAPLSRYLPGFPTPQYAAVTVRHLLDHRTGLPSPSWPDGVVAAVLIRRVTGRTYGEEIHRRIVRPLGLRDTTVPGDHPSIRGPHARGTRCSTATRSA